jgi:predicted nucleic acid-binding protein
VIFFLDASALVKLYHDEAGSEAMRALFKSREYKKAFFISDLVALEVLVRLAKQGRSVGRKERRRLHRAMTTYARNREEDVTIIAAGPGVVREAESFAFTYSDSGAGTLDLLHAASARQVQEIVPDEPLVFVVADRKLRAVVERIGFRTLDPEAAGAVL